MPVVAGSVLNDDEPGYFKEESNGEILKNDSEWGEGFEQEIVEELAKDIIFSNA